MPGYLTRCPWNWSHNWKNPSSFSIYTGGWNWQPVILLIDLTLQPRYPSIHRTPSHHGSMRSGRSFGEVRPIRNMGKHPEGTKGRKLKPLLVGGWTNPFWNIWMSKWIHLPQFFVVKVKHIWVATTQIKSFSHSQRCFSRNLQKLPVCARERNENSPSSSHFQEIQVQRKSAGKTPKINGWKNPKSGGFSRLPSVKLT